MEQNQEENKTQDPSQQVPPAQQGVDQSILLAALCYGIVPPLAVAISLLMLALKKSDEFVLFHAKQGLVFGIFGLVAMMIPLGNVYLAFVGFPVVAVIAITHVFKKEFWKMPVVADVVTTIGV